MAAANSNRCLTETMAVWVQSLAPWSVIAHHTFVWEVGLWSARRLYERFMHGALPGVSFFYALEQNPSRVGYHVHALWDSRSAPRKATWRAWHERYGRNRIEPVRNYLDVVNYCAKYVCKEGAWWDVHLSGARRYAALHRRGGSSVRSNGTVPPERPAGEAILEVGALRV